VPGISSRDRQRAKRCAGFIRDQLREAVEGEVGDGRDRPLPAADLEMLIERLELVVQMVEGEPEFLAFLMLTGSDPRFEDYRQATGKDPSYWPEAITYRHVGQFGGPLAALLEDVAQDTSSADSSSRKTVSARIDRRSRRNSTPER
jgi:hypothetical protein